MDPLHFASHDVRSVLVLEYHQINHFNYAPEYRSIPTYVSAIILVSKLTSNHDTHRRQHSGLRIKRDVPEQYGTDRHVVGAGMCS